MIFTQTCYTELPKPLIISDTFIEQKHESRFLGVIMDDKLKWSQHITSVQSKMSRYVGIMYKIKKYLPLNARIQIFHSFVQSHVHYCSLVWGFSSKSYIETLFAKQKKGLCGVIPGFINYNYRDGVIPGHTKRYFTEYKILTIQNLIIYNALIFMQKIYNYRSLLPRSIIETISNDSPNFESTHESCENWLSTYNNAYYRQSIFCKGPLLMVGSNINKNMSPASLVNIASYKINLKQSLLNIQSSGDTCEWHNNNFPLHNIPGLRKSRVKYRNAVDYTE